MALRSLHPLQTLGIAAVGLLGLYAFWPVREPMRMVGQVIPKGAPDGVVFEGSVPAAWGRHWTGPVGPLRVCAVGGLPMTLRGGTPRLFRPRVAFGWSPVCQVELPLEGTPQGLAGLVGPLVVLRVTGPLRPRIWWWMQPG